MDSERQSNTPCLTRVYSRADGDVASLRVEGEFVDVHLTGADHLHVVFSGDRPIGGHVHVGILRGVILLYPETTNTHKHTLFMACLSII